MITESKVTEIFDELVVRDWSILFRCCKAGS